MPERGASARAGAHGARNDGRRGGARRAAPRAPLHSLPTNTRLQSHTAAPHTLPRSVPAAVRPFLRHPCRVLAPTCPHVASALLHKQLRNTRSAHALLTCVRGSATLFAAAHVLFAEAPENKAPCHGVCRCLATKQYYLGRRLLDQDIYELGGTGLQSADYLLYCFYGAKVCIAIKDHHTAARLLELACTMPTGVGDAIMLAAWHHLQLVVPLHTGALCASARYVFARGVCAPACSAVRMRIRVSFR